MTYLEKIKRLYHLHENSGFSEADLLAMEEAIDIKLPTVLHEYYLVLGTEDSINRSHNRLLKPNEIYFSNDWYLIFFEENQGVVEWGIKQDDFLLGDPPVWGDYDITHKSDRIQETKTLSDFLLLMSIYNGTLGGLKYNANSFSPLPFGTVELIQQNWTEIPEISWEKQKVYTDDYLEVLSLSFDESGQCNAIFIGTAQEERFERMLDIPGIDWSYTSYEDMDDDED